METVLIGKYELKELLGQGELSSVYRAIDPESGEEFAVKLLDTSPIYDPALFARLRMENDIIRELAIPGTLPYMEVSTTEDAIVLVMPLMKGGSLAKIIQERSPLQLQSTLEILRSLAEVVERLHQAGFSHRNLKPGNILFSESGQIFISDFGGYKITQALFPPETEVLLGSLDYQSPESLLDNLEISLEAEQAADRYALGVIFVELLTGRKPFNGRTSLGVAVQKLKNMLGDIDTPRERLPPFYQTVVRTTLARKPEERYQSIPEFVEALETIENQFIIQQQQEFVTARRSLLEIDMLDQTAEPVQYQYSRPLILVLIAIVLLIAWQARDQLSALVNRFVLPGNGIAVTEAAVLIPTLPLAGHTDAPLASTPPATASPLAATLGPTLTSTVPPTNTPIITPSPTISITNYTIQYNQTIFDIASTLGVDLELLMGVNGLYCDSRLTPGKSLFVPPGWGGQHPTSQSIITRNLTPNLEILVVLPCSTRISSVLFTPDGRTVVASSGRDIFLWEVGTWHPLNRLSSHPSEITVLAISPDGRSLVAGTTIGSVVVWSLLEDWQAASYRRHFSEVTDVQFSPDGKFMITTSPDQKAIVWDTASWSVVRQHTGYAAYGSRFSPDSSKYAIGYSNFITIYRTADGSLEQTIESEQVANRLIFSSDGNLISTSSEMWQLSTGERIFSFEPRGDDLAYTADEKMLIVGRTFWDLLNGRRAHVLPIPEAETDKAAYDWDSIAISPDQTLLATGTHDNLLIWGFPQRLVEDPPALRTHVMTEGESFFTVADLYQVPFNELLSTNQFSCQHIPYVGQEILIPDSINQQGDLSALAEVSAGNFPQLSLVRSMDLTCSFTLGALQISEDGQFLSSGTEVWRIASGEPLILDTAAYLDPTRFAQVTRFAPLSLLSPNGLEWAIRAGRSVRFWSLGTGRFLGEPIMHPDDVTSMVWLPDGDTLIMSTDVDESAIHFWDIASESILGTIPNYTAQSLMLARDAGVLVTEVEGTLRFYPIAPLEALPVTISSLPEISGDWLVSQDGNTVVYESCNILDGDDCLKEVVNFFDIDQGIIVSTLLPQNEFIEALGLSNTGSILAAASGDTITFWNAITQARLGTVRLGAERISRFIFSPDDSFVIGILQTGRSLAWRVDTLSLLESPGWGMPVQDLIFSPSGTMVAVLTPSGITLWGVNGSP